MLDNIETLAESLLDKLDAHQFIKGSFSCINFSSVGYPAEPYTTKILHASGKSENKETFLSSLTEEEKSVELRLEFRLLPGDTCPDLPVKVTRTTETQVLKFAEDDPKIYLISFWQTFSNSLCYLKNFDMELRNPRWQGKVENIGICLNDRTDLLTEFIEGNGLNNEKIFWAGTGCIEAEAPRRLGICQYGTNALVFKGKILWIGLYWERNLESDITSLIEEGTFEVKEVAREEVGEVGGITLEDFNNMKTQAEAKISEFEAQYPSVWIPHITVSNYLTFKKENFQKILTLSIFFQCYLRNTSK